jgi:hypothetical protein
MIRKWIFLLIFVCGTEFSIGCQSTGKVETSINPYQAEQMEVKVVVEFKSN